MKAIFLIAALAAAVFMIGCERHYHLVMDGDNNLVIVTAEVPKKVDASAQGQLDLTP
jgi:hypothetical protein